MKILLTGAGGQVAYEVLQQLKESAHQVYAPTRAELDITQFSQLDKVFKNFQPDVVINTAAYTKVDQAEQENELAFSVNAVGARYLAILSAENNNALLHLSTDYVFNGEQATPYVEDDLPSPINVYGQTKLEGEDAIKENCEKYIILRVSSVFGVHGSNFVKTMLRLSQQQKELRVVNDVISCPTPAADIAKVLIQLADDRDSEWGIYHYCGKPSINWYDFAKKILGNYEKLVPVTSAEFNSAAERPKHSVLNCNKIKQVFNIKQPSWGSELKNVISAS